MIYTNDKNADNYSFAGLELEKAVSELKKKACTAFEKGRTDINERLFINSVEYMPNSINDSEMEGHRQYVDVMYMLRGEEKILVCNSQKTGKITKEYDADGDYFLAKIPESYCELTMRKGDICFLFPEDAHAPGVESENKGLVRKLIAKVKI